MYIYVDIIITGVIVVVFISFMINIILFCFFVDSLLL
jgi:hypothetical protein